MSSNWKSNSMIVWFNNKNLGLVNAIENEIEKISSNIVKITSKIFELNKIFDIVVT